MFLTDTDSGVPVESRSTGTTVSVRMVDTHRPVIETWMAGHGGKVL